jgi:adenylate cyclase, class 2
LFLEMEKLVGTGSAALAVQAELDGIARSLGVPMQRVSDTYDSLLSVSSASA